MLTTKERKALDRLLQKAVKNGLGSLSPAQRVTFKQLREKRNAQ